jgi:hypothetical protein
MAVVIFAWQGRSALCTWHHMCIQDSAGLHDMLFCIRLPLNHTVNCLIVHPNPV